jgi:hypothetical protein
MACSGLATHEPHFTILREEVIFGQKKDKTCFRCGQSGHDVSECTGKCVILSCIFCCCLPVPMNCAALTCLSVRSMSRCRARVKKGEHGEFDASGGHVKPLQFLHVHILREYLQFEFEVRTACLNPLRHVGIASALVFSGIFGVAAAFKSMTSPVLPLTLAPQSLERTLPASIPYNIERVIDDFVFMVLQFVELVSLYCIPTPSDSSVCTVLWSPPLCLVAAVLFRRK